MQIFGQLISKKSISRSTTLPHPQYNPVLPQLAALTSEMTAIGQKYGASCSQVGIAWAIAKGTLPIIGGVIASIHSGVYKLG